MLFPVKGSTPCPGEKSVSNSSRMASASVMSALASLLASRSAAFSLSARWFRALSLSLLSLSWVVVGLGVLVSLGGAVVKDVDVGRDLGEVELLLDCPGLPNAVDMLVADVS